MAASVTTAASTTFTNIGSAGSADADPSVIAGYNYRMPALGDGMRLLFQGDSITDMNWGRNQKDRNHYLGHSYVFLIAARLGADMPGVRLDFYNRGISGNTVADLRQRWQKDALAMKPDLLSILIGTNDVGHGRQPAEFESDYRFILDASRAADSGLKLVLLDPFLLPSGPYKDAKAWTSRRAATDKIRAVVARLASDYDAVHVKTQDMFDAAAKTVPADCWIWDGVHPLPQGHELIARHWLEAASARWPLK